VLWPHCFVTCAQSGAGVSARVEDKALLIDAAYTLVILTVDNQAFSAHASTFSRSPPAASMLSRKLLCSCLHLSMSKTPLVSRRGANKSRLLPSPILLTRPVCRDGTQMCCVVRVSDDPNGCSRRENTDRRLSRDHVARPDCTFSVCSVC
jgi:hypothetical protein